MTGAAFLKKIQIIWLGQCLLTVTIRTLVEHSLAYITAAKVQCLLTFNHHSLIPYIFKDKY